MSLDKYLSKRTRQYVKELMSRTFNTQQPKNPDIIKFTNPERTKGINSSGQEVNTTVHGSPSVAGQSYLADPSGNHYVVQGPDPGRTNIDQNRKIAYLLTATVNSSPEKLYIFKIGDATPYFLTNCPVDASNFASRTLVQKEVCAQITPDGKHLVVLYLPWRIGRSPFLKVWKNFSLNKETEEVESDEIINFTGITNDARTGSASQVYMNAYSKADGKVYVDYITFGTSNFYASPFEYPVPYHVRTGVCPEDASMGTLTDLSVVTLYNQDTGFIFTGSNPPPSRLFRSLDNNTSSVWLQNALLTVPPPVSPGLYTNTPLTLSSPIPTAILRQLPAARKSGGILSTNTQWFDASEVIPELPSSAVFGGSPEPFTGQSGTTIMWLGNLWRIKAIDSQKFYLQKKLGDNDDGTWKIEVSIFERNPSTQAITTKIRVSGKCLPLRQTLPDGSFNSSSQYYVVDLSIKNGIRGVA